MLASVPTPSNNGSSNRYFVIDTNTKSSWPLNEMEENMMTLATCSQINHQQRTLGQNNSWREHPQQTTRRISASTSSAVVRCHTCQRKFHSLGNLANHQQLYQH